MKAGSETRYVPKGTVADFFHEHVKARGLKLRDSFYACCQRLVHRFKPAAPRLIVATHDMFYVAAAEGMLYAASRDVSCVAT